MLYTIALVLIILWLLGLVTSYTIGGFIHALLVVAVIMVLVRIIQGVAMLEREFLLSPKPSMKAFHCLFLTVLLLSGLISSAGARETVSMDFFYDNLDPYGTWREVGDYGYCWQPQDVAEDWRPYSEGRWVYTDAGWTWDSDEPFGWAVYHYGRWANVDRYGWIWVPGTEWGPGWVSWRHSPRYIGWAPLPPEAFFLHSIGFSIWVDNYFDIGPGNYRFIENRDFGARRLNIVFIDQSQNYQIINQTTNITHITYVIHNGGPGFDQLSEQRLLGVLLVRPANCHGDVLAHYY